MEWGNKKNPDGFAQTTYLYFHLGFGVVLLEQKPVNDADWISTNASNSSDARTGQDSSGEEDSDDEEPNNSTIEVSRCKI